ncbi:NUDIX domain-containing protein [Paenibacillus albiflavus]|uniref:NUDIX domain-containing protein n=1 Tax=Paenibacillus albiflavus TaxID=2545760 RepID=A0A4R4EGR7_9BACL|nr:NUDIX domain-containing protein [Paenibacillus albiflavus]TCZ79284.1 NUDIX domain-containing protein [Paenibacillus albiflavus]
MKAKLFPLGTIDDSLIKFVVILVKQGEEWVLSKHKHRDTWEFAGGHREVGESVDESAARELFEETGALEFSITPISIYSVSRENENESFGQLYLAQVDRFGPLPESEMAEIKAFEKVPHNLTYPFIYPILIQAALEHMK